MNRKEKIQKTLFGKSYENINTIIITPINTIFNEFSNHFAEKASGWWNNGIIYDNTHVSNEESGKILVVKSPTGKHIEDVVRYAPKSKNILLLGYCGSYNNAIDIGNSFSCNSATDGVGNINSSIQIPTTNSGRIYLVGNFFSQEDPLFAAKLSKLDADCVDMETYHVFQASSSISQGPTRFGAAHIVTDTIRTPFYDVKRKHIEAINAETRKLVIKTLEHFMR